MNISGIGSWCGAHKAIASVLGIAVVCGLVAGGWFGWQEYERRQTAEFATEKIRKALQPADPHELARLANFNAISSELSGAVAEAFPFFLAGPEQKREISQRLQTALLQRFMEKEQGGSMFPEDASERVKLEKPLELLPPDFVGQLAKNLVCRQTGPDRAVLMASINHPQLGRDFTLNMDMRKTPDGWRVMHLANARELAGQLRQAMLKRYAALREVVEKKNSDTARQMNELMPIQSCSADAGALSRGGMVLLVIHAVAHNRGDIQVNNFNLDADITSQTGQVIVSRLLNAAKPVPPGGSFDHRWTMELDSDNPLARQLLAAGPLQCHASWQTLSLARPKVLHIEEVPNPDTPCPHEGHDHPAGFCVLPFFRP